MLGSVITALSSDPEFARRFREAFIAPKIQVSREIYQRAIDRGEIPADVDIEIISPALAGILLHRSFVLGIVPDDETVAARHRPRDPPGCRMSRSRSTSDLKKARNS